MVNKKDTIKIEGYSVGDSSVGIPTCKFSIDTGVYELSDDDKEFLIKDVIRTIWELHDNGDLRYNFSDDPDKEAQLFDYTRRFTYEHSELILKEKYGN
jgi:hypothetical protein